MCRTCCQRIEGSRRLIVGRNTLLREQCIQSDGTQPNAAISEEMSARQLTENALFLLVLKLKVVTNHRHSLVMNSSVFINARATAVQEAAVAGG